MSAEMIHRTAVMTGNQWDLVGYRSSEPKPTSQEPEDRRAMWVARWIEQDASDAVDYLVESIVTTPDFAQRLAILLKTGDTCAIGELVTQLACGKPMCDAADRFFGRVE